MSIDVNARNKQIKKVLSTLFDANNVSVRGGKGTAYGWCDITINGGPRCSTEEFYTQLELARMKHIRQQAEDAIQGAEFYHYWDDMGDKMSMVIIQIELDDMPVKVQ